MAIIFEQYKPQRIFLVQGNVEQFYTLAHEMEDTFAIVHMLNVARFTKDNARTVASFAVEGDDTERAIIVYFSVFSSDAAQLLLKSLEEPDQRTTIVFVTPYPYIVPLTIRSRVALLQTQRAMVAVQTMDKAQALEYVKKELSSDSDDDAATRRASAVALLDQFEAQFKTDAKKSAIIYDAKRMLFKANMPTKVVMEYVASVVL